MDSLTHIVLGGCIGYSLYARRLGPLGFFVPAIAATLPDLDVFFRGPDVVQTHLLHRAFMHSLLLMPLLAAIASFPFALLRRYNPLWKPLYLVALLACLSHPLLDACTSYGTMMLWPFSFERISWDLIAVVNIFFTLPLLVALVWSMRRRSPTPARIGLALCTLYMAFAFVQHSRTADAQARLIAARGLPAEHARVLPQIGAVLNYRSLYVANDRLYADALRIPPIGAATVRPGSALPIVNATDLRPFPAPPPVLADFDAFVWFADGYVARVPDHSEAIGDMRYTLTPEGFDPIWGVQLENTPEPLWPTFPRLRFVNKLLRDLVNPRGFVPLP